MIRAFLLTACLFATPLFAQGVPVQDTAINAADAGEWVLSIKERAVTPYTTFNMPDESTCRTALVNYSEIIRSRSYNFCISLKTGEIIKIQ